MKKPVLVGIVLFAALIALIAYSSMGNAANRVEVCMQYDGRNACRTASGSSKDFALRTATSNACAQIVSGVTDTIKCEHTDPVSVTWK
jgi:hypothetical protein